MRDLRPSIDLALTVALGAAALLIPAAGAAESASTIPTIRATELEHMVIQDCGSCHGLTMKGGLGSPLTPEALDGADAGALATIILDGVPGTAMPPWRPLLSEPEAIWIANYLMQRETEK